MLSASLNGAAVVAAHVVMPKVGTWLAELELDSDEAPEGRATLALGDATLVGTAYRSGVTRGAASVRLVGGAGKLASELPAKSYSSVPLRLPIVDAIASAGETLSSASDASLLARALPRWTRARGRLSETLAALLSDSGASWRVLSDGSIWVGEETWPALEIEHDLISEDPTSGRIEIGSDSFALRPGVMFRSQAISKVEHLLDGDHVRSIAWADGAIPADDLAAAVEAMVRRYTAASAYSRRYPSRVVVQNDDGTLELVPDDARMPSISTVPIRSGVPGIYVRVKVGARVSLEFEAGDPSRPVATIWDEGAIAGLMLRGALIDLQGAQVQLQGRLVQTLGGSI